MKHLGLNFIISRIRSDEHVELVDRASGKLVVQRKDEVFDRGIQIENHDLLTIPGILTLSERLSSNPSFLSDLRTRRLEYVKTKVKTIRRKRQTTTDGEVQTKTQSPRRLSAASKAKSARGIDSTLARITAASGTSESDKKLAIELANLLKGM